jgi:hypothetical protein
MKRVRQESSEVIEVTGTEIATALGLYVEEGDQVSVESRWGDDVLTVRVSVVIEEDEELPLPGINPASAIWDATEDEDKAGRDRFLDSEFNSAKRVAEREVVSLAEALRSSLRPSGGGKYAGTVPEALSFPPLGAEAI